MSRASKLRTTKQYRDIYEFMQDGLLRLQADHASFTVLATSNDPRTKRNARNGILATSIQIRRQKAALTQKLAEARRQYNNGRIYKFW